MKILHVDTGKSWRGGQKQVLDLHRGLIARGVQSLLLCTRGGELLRRAAALGLPVEGLALRGEWDLVSAWAVARRLRRWKATHLHLHTSHAQGIGLVAARMAGFSNVVATRRVDFPIRKHLANRWKYGPSVARYVAISRSVAARLSDFGIPAERIRVAPSGVALERAAPGAGGAFRRELGLAPDALLVGNIAHLSSEKGQRDLVDAIPAVLAVHPEARFVLVGEGALRGELERRARELGLGERLAFTGFRDDVDVILDALDVFVMSSHAEGLGTAVADALAARRAVVATRVGGIPDIVEDGVEGLLVPPRDPAALAAAIGRLLDDPELRRRLGEAGRAKVERSFSVDAMVEGNLAVYREMGDFA